MKMKTRITLKKIKLSKKAVSVWLSWVLLIAITVALGSFIYMWTGNLTRGTLNQMQTSVYDTSECAYVGVSIDSICQDTQALYMNISNTNNLKVNTLLFRLYSIYDEPAVIEFNVTIGSEKTEEIELAKQGTIKAVEVIPSTNKGSRRIICRQKMTETDKINDCY